MELIDILIETLFMKCCYNEINTSDLKYALVGCQPDPNAFIISDSIFCVHFNAVWEKIGLSFLFIMLEACVALQMAVFLVAS